MLFFLILNKFEYTRIGSADIRVSASKHILRADFPAVFPHFPIVSLRDVTEQFLKRWPTMIVGRWVQLAMWPWLFAHAKRRADNMLTQQTQCTAAAVKDSLIFFNVDDPGWFVCIIMDSLRSAYRFGTECPFWGFKIFGGICQGEYRSIIHFCKPIKICIFFNLKKKH